MVSFILSRVSLRALAGSTAPGSSYQLRATGLTRGITTASSLTQVSAHPVPPTVPPTVKKSASAAPPRASRKERRTALKAQKKAAKRRVVETSLAARLGVQKKTVAPLVRKDHQFVTYKPITRSIRWLRRPVNDHLFKGKPEKALTIAKRSTAGRNNTGQITVRGRGGGHKRRLRLVDFYRWEEGKQDVLRIEYDPGRSAHLALIEHQETKRRSYILAPDGMRAGDSVQSYRLYAPNVSQASSPVQVESADKDDITTDPAAPQTTKEPTPASSSSFVSAQALDMGIFRTQAIRPGNFLPLNLIPVGTTIHSITLLAKGPAKLVRAAGASGQLVAFSGRHGAGDSHAQIKLQSGEVRLVPSTCCAAIGTVSNRNHQHRVLGKAGRSRHLGIRPKVRGVAMNAVDHPHGGGRGKSKSNMHPKSIYGNLAKFARTRKPGTKRGNRMVIRERPRRNGKRLGKP